MVGALALAVTFSLACALASIRRLQYALELTTLDVGALAASLRKARAALPASPVVALESMLSELPSASWEREIVAALGQPPEARTALIGEAMTELDFSAHRWSKVPRVCASLASSFGFLLATMSLRVGLSALVGPLDDATVMAVNGAILDALDVAAVGLAGAAACVAIHYSARVVVGRQIAGAQQLVDLLEQLTDTTPLVSGEGRATVPAPHSTETFSSPTA